MKKQTIGIALFLLLGAGGIGYVALQNNEASTVQTSIVSTTPTPETTTEQISETVQAPGTGTYVDYSETALAQASGDTYLFFHAPWCSQCRSIEKGISEQGVPEGVTILKVDYDSNQSLRTKYGVRLQTTFVKLNEDNSKASLFVAYEEPTFDAVKRDYIL